MRIRSVMKLVSIALLAFAALPVIGGDRPIVKVSVLASGQVLIDGQPSDMQQLRAALTSVSEGDGAVWYYRENGLEEASPQAMQVIELVMEMHLPISMSSQPDFSDYIDGQGHSHPRQE